MAKYFFYLSFALVLTENKRFRGHRHYFSATCISLFFGGASSKNFSWLLEPHGWLQCLSLISVVSDTIILVVKMQLCVMPAAAGYSGVHQHMRASFIGYLHASMELSGARRYRRRVSRCVLFRNIPALQGEIYLVRIRTCMFWFSSSVNEWHEAIQ